MISFLFRIARRAITVKQSRFWGLTLTLFAASVLLVVLSALYLNAESQLKIEVSGVPNIVVQPESDFASASALTPDDVIKLKSKTHFWRNNILTAAPIAKTVAMRGGRSVDVAGTWFQRDVAEGEEHYAMGLLTFPGWKYAGRTPDTRSVIVGADVPVSGPTVTLSLDGQAHTFDIAGTITTGYYWDDYVFMDMETLNRFRKGGAIDQILVSSLIKPKDRLARKVEQYGPEALGAGEFEQWYCSPYSSTISYTIGEVIPHSEVRIMRRVTEVQEGIIQASSGVFVALFLLTLIAAITAIFSAEKMYITSHTKDFGIMTALGGSNRKMVLQLLIELGIAAVLSGLATYAVGILLLNGISNAIFYFDFEAHGSLFIHSMVIPFVTMGLALFGARKSLTTDIVAQLKVY